MTAAGQRAAVIDQHAAAYILQGALDLLAQSAPTSLGASQQNPER
jgi:hypothetical protein